MHHNKMDEYWNAVLLNDTLRILELINKGISVNEVNENNGRTALHYAAENGNLELCKELLKINAYILVTDDYNALPIELARLNDHTEISELLARNSNHDYNAFFKAVRDNDVEMLAKLIDEGVSVDLPDLDFRQTALHLAIIYNCKKVFDELIRRDADVGIEDDMGYAPVHYALQNERIEMIMPLVERETHYKHLEDVENFLAMLECDSTSSPLATADEDNQEIFDTIL